jgi:hypothetical protein
MQAAVSARVAEELESIRGQFATELHSAIVDAEARLQADADDRVQRGIEAALASAQSASVEARTALDARARTGVERAIAAEMRVM